MTEQPQETIDSKTCPNCGGTWPSDRRNCLACGTNLELVPARPVGEEQEQGPFHWAWLDAMAEEGTAPAAPDSADDKEQPGCLARLLPRLDP